MIGEPEARLAFARHLALGAFGDPPGTYGLRRVRGGWLAWADRDDPPEGTPAGIRLELRDADNTPPRRPPWFLRWPVWPAEDIADRIDASTDDDRFPPYVQAVLETSGWFPGRAIPEHHLDDLATQFAALPIEDEEDMGDEVYRPVLHDAARTALREFGGLRLPFVLHIAPDPGWTWDASDADTFGCVLGQPFALVGHAQDLQVLMAPNGLCLLTGLFNFNVGASFDEMITYVLTHPRPFPLLDIDAAKADQHPDPPQS